MRGQVVVAKSSGRVSGLGGESRGRDMAARVPGLIGGNPSGRGIVLGFVVGEPRRQEVAESQASLEASRAGRIWRPGLVGSNPSTRR